MPYRIVNAFVVMLPVLEAEEQLARITAVAVGTENTGKAEREKIIRELQTRAGQGQERRNGGMIAKLIMLSGMGIQVVDMRSGKHDG